MVPSLENLVQYRYIATLLLRIAGLVILIHGSVGNIDWIVEVIRDRDLFDMTLYYIGRMTPYVAEMAIGVVFLTFAGPIVRLFSPFPRAECPRCRYPLRNRGAAYCSECGLRLPRAFTEDVSTAGELARPRDAASGSPSPSASPGAPPAPPVIVRDDAPDEAPDQGS